MKMTLLLVPVQYFTSCSLFFTADTKGEEKKLFGHPSSFSSFHLIIPLLLLWYSYLFLPPLPLPFLPVTSKQGRAKEKEGGGAPSFVW